MILLNENYLKEEWLLMKYVIIKSYKSILLFLVFYSILCKDILIHIFRQRNKLTMELD